MSLKSLEIRFCIHSELKAFSLFVSIHSLDKTASCLSPQKTISAQR